MTCRLLQNFKGGRALVVIGRSEREGALESTLAKLGVTTEYPDIVGGRAQIDVGSLQPERDILFVDGDLEGAIAIEVNPASRLPPVPVIGLVGVEAPSRLKALVNLGATSFLRKPVHAAPSTRRCSWASTSSCCAVTCMPAFRISKVVAAVAARSSARSSS
jgi:AmiR/NasT family two-component response regulator